MKRRCAPILVAVFCTLLPVLAWASAIASQPLAKESRLKANSSSVRWYGLDLSGYLLENSSIEPRQSLSTLLNPYGVPATVLLETAKLAASVFDVRRIKPGRPYTVARDPGRAGKVRYLIYDHSVDTYVVFDLGEPLNVYTGQKELQTQTRLLAGTITTTLLDAITEQRADPGLVSGLNELFAGRVDLRSLSQGDGFAVIYDVQYAAGKQVALGDIKAAVLTCDGAVQLAFQFSHHGTTGYYDETGRNVQKAFLESPLMYTRVTSGFMDSRLHPIKKVYLRHPAIDYAAPAGTAVMSVGDGVVSDTGYSRSAGNFIKVEHPGPYASLYMHLSAVADGIKLNTQVDKGDIIGFVGSTGLATGPHLDFRFLLKERYVDYTDVDLPTGEPVDADCLDRFRQKVIGYHTRLSVQTAPAFDLISSVTKSIDNRN